MAKFNKGDKVVVKSVKSASSIGYIGSLRKVSIVKPCGNDTIYFTNSVIGAGGAWFYESELTRAS